MSCANQSCPCTVHHSNVKNPLYTLKFKDGNLKLCALCCDLTRKFLPGEFGSCKIKKDLASLKEDVKDFRTHYDGLLSTFNIKPTSETKNFGKSNSESQEPPNEEVPSARHKRKKNQTPTNSQDNHSLRGPSPPPEVWLDEEQTPPRKRNRRAHFSSLLDKEEDLFEDTPTFSRNSFTRIGNRDTQFDQQPGHDQGRPQDERSQVRNL